MQNEDYKEWLESVGINDSKINREWFNCPEEKRADFLRKHPDYLTKTMWE